PVILPSPLQGREPFPLGSLTGLPFLPLVEDSIQRITTAPLSFKCDDLNRARQRCTAANAPVPSTRASRARAGPPWLTRVAWLVVASGCGTAQPKLVDAASPVESAQREVESAAGAET